MFDNFWEAIMKKQFNPISLFIVIIVGSLFFLERLSFSLTILTLSIAAILGLLINYMRIRTLRLYKVASIIGSFALAHYLVVITPSSSLSYLFFLAPITLACLVYHCKGGIATYGATLLFLFFFNLFALAN